MTVGAATAKIYLTALLHLAPALLCTLHMAFPRKRRPGFILLFGSRNIISNDNTPPVQTNCPRCGQAAEIIGRTYRTWFTIFFLPVFPMSASRRFSECSLCHAQFPVPVEDLRRGLASNEQQQNQQAITHYISLRASPANAITL